VSPRVAVVTGAARGIGLAAAAALLEAGHRVALLDRDIDGVPAALPARVRERAVAIRADVTDKAAVRAALESLAGRWGAAEILVNNAGVSPKIDGRSAGILEVTDAEFDLVMDVNLRAVVHLCQLCIPAMRERGFGRIVNIASLAGRTRSVVSGATYMASKAAVIGLSRSIATEMARRGITTNCVAPGRILTEMAMQAGPEVNARYAQAIPVGRLGTPDEVGAAIAFLCRDDAGFINGAVLDINGGFYMP